MTRERWSGAVLGLGLVQPAFAHGEGPPVGPADLAHHWSFDPVVLLPLLLACLLYVIGIRRLWAEAGRGRGISVRRAASFGLGVAILLAALVSPLDALGETLFAAHMVQHALLLGLAPPLMVAGWLSAASAWALPRALRRGWARHASMPRLRRFLRPFVRPLPAAVIHGAVMWLWHVPLLYDAALRHPWLHRLEHVTFFATAMMFWQAVALSGRGTAAVPAGIAALFGTMLQGGFLSVLITFAPQPLYPWYIGRTEAWGITALTDQQLAGLLMGAPLSLVYLGASLVLAARLLAPGAVNRGPGPIPPSATAAQVSARS